MQTNQALKHRGFRQGLFDISSTAKEMVGQVRFDGLNAYRYCKAGSSALSPGKLALSPELGAAWLDEAITAAVAIGTQVITETITSITLLDNQLKGGFFQITDGTGEGHQYRIDGNAAVSAGTTLNLALEAPGIRVALDTTSTFTIAQNPCYATIEATAEEADPVGVTLIDVTASYYYWAQVSGIALVLQNGTLGFGEEVCPGAVAGSVKLKNATFDPTMPTVGIKAHADGVDTEYHAVRLLLL